MFDAHSHIRITNDDKKNTQNINEYILNMKKNGIKEAIVMVDPFIDELKCPLNSNHYVKTKNGTKPGHIICKCTFCQKVVYEGIDPFIKYNIYLMDKLTMYSNLHVYPVISVTDTSMQWLIDYYQDLFGPKLEGIKAYTGLSAYSLDDLKPVRCNVPMLVHEGTYQNQNPAKMIQFIKKFNNYFQIAHFAGLELDAINELKKIDNVFIDVSPATYMFDYYIAQNHNGGLFNKNKILSLEDMYYMLLSNFDLSRIVWGSDTPYSTQDMELDAILKSKIFTQTEKELVLCKNIRKIIKI